MPNVTKVQTIKNADNTVTELYYGVANTKYIEVTENHTLDKELLNIHEDLGEVSTQVNTNIANIASLVTKTDTTNDNVSSLITRLNNLESNIATRLTELETSMGELETTLTGLISRVEALENPNITS